MSEIETGFEVPPAGAADGAGQLPAERPRRRIAPVIALVVAAVLGGLFWVLASSNSGTTDVSGLADSPLLGKPAPSVVSTTVDDGTFDLSRRKGSWVVLNFFQSDCVPCRAEHPELVKFVEQQALFADGAEFYTIIQPPNSDDDVRAFFAERGGDWPVVRDDNGLINVAFAVAQVPETFIVNPDGIVVARWAGQIDAITLAQLLQVQRLSYGAQ
ncbi:MAG: redoxin domain-containing protein [Actinomycetota bacterium]|nr:redoxin domain-containing protein [Actinomycetota bacterium]